MSGLAPFFQRYDIGKEKLVELHTILSVLNYRIVSICGYGHVTDPRYAVVWAFRGATAPEQRIEQVGPSTQKDVYAHDGKNYYPVLVGTTGNAGYKPSFLVVAEERAGSPTAGKPYAFPILLTGLVPAMAIGKTTTVATNLPVEVPNFPVVPGTVGQAFSDAKRGVLVPAQSGFTGVFALLTSVARYRDTDGTLKVAATFLPQPRSSGIDDFVPWGVDLAVNAKSEKTKRSSFIFSPAGVRLEQLVLLHDDPSLAESAPRFIQVWQDNQLPEGWIIESELSPEQYEEKRKYYESSYGFYPVRLNVFDESVSVLINKPAKRFTAIFAQTDEPIARTARKKQLIPKASVQNLAFDPPEFDAWSTWMMRLLQTNGIRGGQLAVTFNGRLVFSKAYTWAEPSYPDLEIKTAINVGSVSKGLTCLATLRVLDAETNTSEGLLDALNANYWKLMGVTAPGQDNALENRLDGITLVQLITLTSGIGYNYCTETDDIDVAKARNVDLPLPSDEAWQYFLDLKTVKTIPNLSSSLNRYFYIGTHFFLLERWLQKKSGTTSGEAAMQALLFDPIGAERARIGGSSVWLADEAIRHRVYTYSEKSHIFNDLHIGPAAYSRRWMPLIAPSGGWTMPATDLARVVASIDWDLVPGRTPLLTSRGKDALLTVRPGVKDKGGATKAVTYGGMYRVDWSDGATSLASNGSLDGAQSLMVRYDSPTIGGVVGVALSVNANLAGADGGLGNLTEGTLVGTPDDLLAVVPAQWPDWDLFDSESG